MKNAVKKYDVLSCVGGISFDCRLHEIVSDVFFFQASQQTGKDGARKRQYLVGEFEFRQFQHIGSFFAAVTQKWKLGRRRQQANFDLQSWNLNTISF